MKVALIILRTLAPILTAILVTVWRCRVLSKRREKEVDKKLARLKGEYMKMQEELNERKILRLAKQDREYRLGKAEPDQDTETLT